MNHYSDADYRTLLLPKLLRSAQIKIYLRTVQMKDFEAEDVFAEYAGAIKSTNLSDTQDCR